MTRRIHGSLLIGGLVLGIGLLHVAGVLQPVEDVVRSTAIPVARVFAAVGFEVGRRTASGETMDSLQNRVNELQSRLSSTVVDYVQLRALQEENRSLRKVGKFLSDSEYDHVGARVIARSTLPQTSTVLIDRGVADGLEIGMAVVAEDGIFVGKIISIQQRVARVQLVTDTLSRVAAAHAGADHLIGIVQGEENGVARLTLVPQAEELKRDDSIVTAGTEEKIPANLPIGLVNQVEGKQTDPFKTASLEPLVQSSRLDLVIVLRPAALRPGS